MRNQRTNLAFSRSKSVMLSPKNSGSIQKINNLNNKVTPFKRNFNNTVGQTESKSVIFKLAHSIYNKNPKRHSSSIKKIKVNNPEYTNTAMNNLMTKTLEVPEYIKQLSRLNKQKKDLQIYIDNLKKNISVESKMKNELSHQAKKHMNMIETTNQNIRKLQNDSAQLEFNINITQNDINQVKNYVNMLNNQNKSVIQTISIEKQNISQLNQFLKHTRINMLTQDKKLAQVKSNLMLSLKAMNNNSVYIKFLENEKAEMLLYINKQFEYNKIRNN